MKMAPINREQTLLKLARARMKLAYAFLFNSTTEENSFFDDETVFETRDEMANILVEGFFESLNAAELNIMGFDLSTPGFACFPMDILFLLPDNHRIITKDGKPSTRGSIIFDESAFGNLEQLYPLNYGMKLSADCLSPKELL